MSNIIKVKEERNVLSFASEVFKIVADSTNFYLQFEFDEQWSESSIFTVIFDFDGRKEYVELDSDLKCKIPPTSSEKILFCVTTEPSENEKYSSTILSLTVESSGETDLKNIEPYENSHDVLLGLIGNLKTGNGVVAEKARYSETQVSQTGDETISGEKNFIGTLKSKSEIVPNISEVSNYNYIINGDLSINSRGNSAYTRSGTNIYAVDRWGIFTGNGKYRKNSRTFTGLNETGESIFCQWIEDADSLFYGQTITVSALIDGVRRYKTITLPVKAEMPTVYTENIYKTQDYTFRILFSKAFLSLGVQFIVGYNVSITINEVKVEKGSLLTRFEQRSTAEELVMCQRYWQKIYPYAMGYAYSAEKLYFHVPLPTSMRGTETFRIVQNPTILKDGETVSSDSFAIYQVYPNGLVLIANGSGYETNKLYYLVGGLIYIDGEMYY